MANEKTPWNNTFPDKYFRAVLVIGLLVSCILLFTSEQFNIEPARTIVRQLSMIVFGAILAIVISQIILGSYFRYSSEKLIMNAIEPGLKSVETAINQRLEQIVPEVKTEAVRSIDDIRARVAEASDFLVNGIGVLSGAKEAGIISIFPTRYSKIAGKSAIEIIADDMRTETTRIRIMGISLGDYFLDRGVLRKPFLEVLNSSGNSGFKIEALILDPNCQALLERARWEAGSEYRSLPHVYESTTYIETDGAARIARRLCLQRGNCLQVRLYEQAPTAFVLLTSRFAFIEGYTYACRGSNVPFLQVQAGAHLYKCFESHFERVWDVASPISSYIPLYLSTPPKPT